MGSLKSHRLKRGLSKLQPKWKNPQAAKSFYMNTFGMIFMFSSFAAPFWTMWAIKKSIDCWWGVALFQRTFFFFFFPLLPLRPTWSLELWPLSFCFFFLFSWSKNPIVDELKKITIQQQRHFWTGRGFQIGSFRRSIRMCQSCVGRKSHVAGWFVLHWYKNRYTKKNNGRSGSNKTNKKNGWRQG